MSMTFRWGRTGAALLSLAAAATFTGCVLDRGGYDDSYRQPIGAPPPPPVAGQWLLLGQTTVDYKADTDVINVNPNQGFQRLQVSVDNGDIEMYLMRIRFSDGSYYEPPLRQVFAAGNRQVVIDLPGRVRSIVRVAFNYRAVGGGGPARVSLLGQ